MWLCCRREQANLFADRYQQFVHEVGVRVSTTARTESAHRDSRSDRGICAAYFETPRGQTRGDLVGRAGQELRLKSGARGRDLLWVSARIDLGVGIDYPQPETIGADRLANAAAVTTLYGFPAIVVDFGTAVTFDIVSEKKRYIGGVIAPGLESMTNFLYQRTALLPKLSLKEPRSAVGKSTAGAMMAGAIYGYRGLVREILERIRSERFPRQRVKVVATGGYAQLIGRQMREIQSVHPNLTLEGLRIVAALNS